MLTVSEAREIVDRIKDEHMNALTPWERQFVESIDEQLDRRGALTEKQAEKLDEIWTALP